MLRPHLQAAGFTLFPARPDDRTYFELCAVRAPWVVRRHRAEPLWRSQFGRWLHTLEVEGPDGPVTLFTAHFDSGPEPGTARVREAQARDVATRLEARAVFAGDTNLRDAEWRRVEPALSARDAWTLAGAPAAHRFTWWGDRHARARFDRAWVSPDGRVEHFETFGRNPVTGLGRPPSDHAGLRLRVRFGPSPDQRREGA